MTERSCACGCGWAFLTNNPARRYLHPTHRPRKARHYTPDELRQRRILLANPPNGDPCPRCQQPMWWDQRLQTGHVHDRALGGTGMGLRWEHGRCNEAAGATVGNRMRAGTQRTTITSRTW